MTRPTRTVHTGPAADLTPVLGRRRFLGLSLATGVAASAATLLAACGTGAATAGTSASTIKWGWDLPTSWDPVTSSAGWDVHALSLVYAGLTKLDQAGTAVPALASGWAYDSTGTRVTFTLRSGLTFADGTPLDATAVTKSILRGRDLPGSLVAPQLANIAAVSASDPTTVVIALRSPDYQVPNLLAGKTGMIVNPAVFERDATGIATKPAGAGPFTLTTYVQNSKATLVKNPKYWDQVNIKVDDFELYPLPDASTVVAGLQSGQYNVAQIPGSQVQSATAAGLKVQVIPSLVVATLDVNIAKKPFDDPYVTQALHFALDRAALLKTAQFGHGDVAYQPFPKGYAGYNAALDGIYAYDPAKAQQLLAQSSYGANPVPVVITTSVAEGVPEQVQAQLKAVGFTATIEVIPAAQFTQDIYVQHAKALSVDQFAGRDSAVQAFQVLFGRQGLMNPGRVEPPELITALAMVSRTPLDDPSYPSVLQNATAVAVHTMPNIFLYTVPRILARRADVSADSGVHRGAAVRGRDRVMTTLIERAAAPSRAIAAVPPPAVPPPPVAPPPGPPSPAAPPHRRPRRVTPRSVARAVAIPVVVFLVSSLLTYGLGALSPSNPAAAVLGDAATPADIARMNHRFGLDRPFLEQYVTWLGHAFTGNLGRSYFTTIPVAQSIGAAIPVDLGIAGLALLLAVFLGGAAGITAALRRGGRLDRAITLVASALATLPPFVVGISLIVVLSVWAHAFPAGGYAPLSAGPTTWFRFAILPAAALSLDLAAAVARQLRTSLVAQLGENYVVGAVVRGMPTRQIVLGQVLRNAAGPALTVLGSGIPILLGGAVVTEKIFNLPGVAQLALQASTSHDVPLIQGTLLVTAAVVLVCNTAVNGALSLLTPQARSPRSERVAPRSEPRS